MATLKSIKNKYLTTTDGDAIGVKENTENIALLAFKLAAADSLTKFNMVDGVIDDFQDTSGFDASGSTNEVRNTDDKFMSGAATQNATGGTITTYTESSVSYVVHTFTTSGTFRPPTGTGGNVDCWMIAGGGGGGGVRGHGGEPWWWGGAGGGGAGGFKYFGQKPHTVQDYAVVIGAGGGGSGGNSRGTAGGVSSVTPQTSGSAISCTGGGGGGMTSQGGQNPGGSEPGGNGGCGGGGGGRASQPGGTGVTNEGFGGGSSTSGGGPYGGDGSWGVWGGEAGGGGGGTKSSGSSGGTSSGGNGGAGLVEGTDYVYDWHAAQASTLASAMSANDTTATLASASGFVAPGFAKVDSEVLTVNSISGNVLTINACTSNHNSGANIYVYRKFEIDNTSAAYGGGGAGNDEPSHNASGGAGGGGDASPGHSDDAVDGTGGGGSGEGRGSGSTGQGGDGGNGRVVFRYTDTEFLTYNDMVLVSAQVTAVTEPSFADIVVLMNPATGSQTINTHLIAYIGQSANSTPVYTSALTLVEEATQGTKRIWAARNVDISALSGTNMNYKLTTHSQSASLETRVHSVSLAWR